MTNSIANLNLYAIFFGATFNAAFLLEIVIRTTVMYLYTLINLRVFKTRSIAQLTSFELIIVIALGSAVGDPMFYPTPLINGMMTITIIVILTKLISIFNERSQIFELLMEGKPELIIKNGEIIKANLRRKNISEEELFSRLRYKGIKNIGEVEYAFIETSGQMSVIEYKDPRPGLSTLNHID
jgi:uncharacterized membrane protein YcaP (DUF421 family)